MYMVLNLKKSIDIFSHHQRNGEIEDVEVSILPVVGGDGYDQQHGEVSRENDGGVLADVIDHDASTSGEKSIGEICDRNRSLRLGKK